MKPIVATLWGETVLILAIEGERVTFVREGGRIDFIDLDTEGCNLTVAYGTVDFPALEYGRFSARAQEYGDPKQFGDVPEWAKR